MVKKTSEGIENTCEGIAVTFQTLRIKYTHFFMFGGKILHLENILAIA